MINKWQVTYSKLQETEMKPIEMLEFIKRIAGELIQSLDETTGTSYKAEQYVNVYKAVYDAWNRRDLRHEELYEIFDQCLSDYIKGVINQKRQGKLVDWGSLKDGIELFRTIQPNATIISMCMQRYTDGFEKPLFADASSYYSQIAPDHIKTYSCPEYMFMVEQWLKKEDEIAASSLPLISHKRLMVVARHELLIAHHKQLLEKEHSGLKVLLQHGKVEDLKRMYKLFSHTEGGLGLISSVFGKFFTENGIALIEQAKKAVGEKKVFPEGILQLYDEFAAYISYYFNDNSVFYKALAEAFEVLCNEDKCSMTTAEILSRFVHNILKKGSGSDKLSDPAIKEKLKKMSKLVSYIHEKDLFVEFHRKNLALRFLHDKNSNMEHERYFALKLKTQNDDRLTSKIEGMINDFSLTRERRIYFKNFLKKHRHEKTDDHSFDMVVRVLTAGLWPSLDSSALRLPPELAQGVEVFKKFYDSQNKRKKLTWSHSLGTCTLIGHFDQKPIELMLTTYQKKKIMKSLRETEMKTIEVLEFIKRIAGELIQSLDETSGTSYKVEQYVNVYDAVYDASGRRDLRHEELYEIFDQCLSDYIKGVINQERAGKLVDWGSLKDGIELFRTVQSDATINGHMRMQRYTDGFEKPLFADASSFYSQIAAHYIKKYSCPEYMFMVEWWLKSEDEIAARTLPLISHKGLMAFFIENGIALIEQAKEVVGEKKIYLLLCFPEGILQLYDEFAVYITNYFNDNTAFYKMSKLVSYIHEKDLFVEFHRKNLALRLLHDKNKEHGT
ncbi:hypothetical protein J5N97_018199 [Dioscorea zingiberensis]|uniref:Cullin family profile domain-containing protein n=1 Tax=Dioscorea zingiberensis TaxID=325984 RepID=A0A9D5HH35_9LILI|nr:hypothetical protein J5N97_018199 [Dioscorea zingiberensis]